jgi:hypothetical protein
MEPRRTTCPGQGDSAGGTAGPGIRQLVPTRERGPPICCRQWSKAATGSSSTTRANARSGPRTERCRAAGALLAPRARGQRCRICWEGSSARRIPRRSQCRARLQAPRGPTDADVAAALSASGSTWRARNPRDPAARGEDQRQAAGLTSSDHHAWFIRSSLGNISRERSGNPGEAGEGGAPVHRLHRLRLHPRVRSAKRSSGPPPGGRVTVVPHRAANQSRRRAACNRPQTVPRDRLLSAAPGYGALLAASPEPTSGVPGLGRNEVVTAQNRAALRRTLRPISG